jgi:hypothetical protein
MPQNAPSLLDMLLGRQPAPTPAPAQPDTLVQRMIDFQKAQTPPQAPLAVLRPMFEGGVDLVSGVLGMGQETKANQVGQMLAAAVPLGGIGKTAAKDFLKQQLDTFGGLAKADAAQWAFSPHDASRSRLVESFKPHLKDLHSALERTFGKTVTLYRAESAKDPSSGVRSFSLSREGAEEFLGQNYRQGTSDTLHAVEVPVEDILAIGSTYSGEVLVDSTKHIRKK